MCGAKLVRAAVPTLNPVKQAKQAVAGVKRDLGNAAAPLRGKLPNPLDMPGSALDPAMASGERVAKTLYGAGRDYMTPKVEGPYAPPSPDRKKTLLGS